MDLLNQEYVDARAQLGASVSLHTASAQTIMEKLSVLTDAAKYDVACTSSGVDDVPRATFTPDEICELTMNFYRRNYIEGLFLSSGIIHNPSYTMELLYQTLYKLRKVYRFQGYVHVKGIPGADPVLIQQTGFLHRCARFRTASHRGNRSLCSTAMHLRLSRRDSPRR